jgi:hypothetical protein
MARGIWSASSSAITPWQGSGHHGIGEHLHDWSDLLI